MIKRRKRDDSGQGTIEYVLLILGCVLFLVVAAKTLRVMESKAISSISSWANRIGPPGSGQTNQTNQTNQGNQGNQGNQDVATIHCMQVFPAFYDTLRLCNPRQSE